jgi:mannosyltransferase
VAPVDLTERGDNSRAGCLWPLGAVGAALLAACLGALFVGRKSLDVDEANAAEVAGSSLRDLLEHVARADPGQAVQLVLLHPVVEAGDAEWALRAPSVLALALAVLLVYPLGARLFGRVAGLTAALALATCAGAVGVAQQARPLAFGLFGIVLSSLFLVRGLERGSTGRWIAYALSAAALPLLHPAAAAALGAQAAAAGIESRHTPRRLGGVAIALAVALPLVLATVLDRRDAVDGAPQLHLLDFAAGFGSGLGWNLVLLAAGAAGVGLVAAGGVSGAGLWQAVLAGGLALVPLLALLLVAIALPVYPDRVLVFAVPGLALGAGALVSALPPRWATAAAVTLTTAAAATLVLWYVSEPDEDWRAAARDAERRRAADETVVVAPERARAAFAYYAPRARTWQRAYGEGAWVLVHAPGDAQAIARARRVVPTPRYALAEQITYGDDLRLQHWVRP